jgi:hypothetical protein
MFGRMMVMYALQNKVIGLMPSHDTKGLHASLQRFLCHDVQGKVSGTNLKVLGKIKSEVYDRGRGITAV